MTKLFWHLDTDFHYKGQIQLRLKTFFTILLFGRTGASILLDAYWILIKAFLVKYMPPLKLYLIHKSLVNVCTSVMQCCT